MKMCLPFRLRRAASLPLVLSALLGCAPPTAASRTAAVLRVPAPEDSLDLHFEAIAAGFESEGLRRGALHERGFLPPSGRAAHWVHIEKNECAVFVALATPSMADLDASLFTAEGSALIEDDSTGSRPALTFCASASAPVDAYLTLHAYQGAGSYVAAQFRRPRRADDDLHTASFAGPFASALGQLAQTLHARGFEDAAPRVSVPVGTGAVRLAVHVIAGECYTLAAEGGEGVAELGLRLVDSHGGELAYGVGEPSLAALQYCASDPAELSLELVARRGQGIAQVARFRAAQATLGGARALWLGEPSPSAAAWSQAKSSAEPGAVFFSKQLPLRQGEVVELASKLGPRAGGAACQRWQATLEPGLSAATLRVESERGELLAEADSEQQHACVQVCGASGPLRVSLIGRTGFGSVSLRAHGLAAVQAGMQSDQAALVFDARPCHGSSAAGEAP
jgi:hypothetical protein